MSQPSIGSMRVHYAASLFDTEHCAADPIIQFGAWFNQAVEVNVLEPNAMTLATASKDAKPSARIVLLKDVTNEGFMFYTNYESRKGQQIEENNAVALCFNWLELHRQVRIEGTAYKLTPEVSEIYFQSRPKGSQIGAWASPQSKVIPSRETIENKQAELTLQYQDSALLPLPPFWGGYNVVPESIEFWQGRPDRLHDRILYTRKEKDWIIERLAP